MLREETDRLAQIIWEYHHVNHKLKKADCLFVLGSHDIRVAEYAARLFHEGWAPYIIFSGGMAHNNDMLNTGWDKSEAEILADRAINMGVPEANVLLEKEAHNTGENVQFSEKVLEAEGISYDKVIAVQKPYMERRTYATIRIHWPDKKLIVSSPPISYSDYPNGEISRDELINIMVGDLQRIIEYPALGFQIVQEVPDDVMSAYKQLIQMGFSGHLIKQSTE
jgi:uncharacterized SAM-binding protein YcdF (DUF218 family)